MASLTLRGEARTGPIKKVAITNLAIGGPSRVVTAIRQGDDRLKLIVWDVSGAGELTRRGDFLGDQITEADVTALSTSRVATAVRKANGNLEVTVFDVSNSGALTPRGSGGGGQIDVMAIQSLAADTVVTSVRGGADKLKVIRWKIGSDGSIGRDGEEDSIEVGVIDCAGSQSFVTAVSDRDGNLRLLHWLQGRASGIFRGGSGGGGEIAAVRIAGDGGATGRWFTASTDPGPTAVRTGVFGGGRLLIGAGVLKVIEWRLVEPVSDRSDLQRRGEAQVAGSDGISFDLALTRADPGSFFVTAAASVGSYRRALPRDRGKPLLKLTVWELNDSITPLTSATLGGEYDSLSIATIRNPQGNDHRFVTAVRGTGDQLKLNVWDFLP